MAESRERPILFSGPMVRAVLEGRKTQTRRILKPQPAPNAPNDGGTTWMFRPRDGRHVPCGTVGHLTVAEKVGLLCPYGVPGNRLWVRETFYCDVPDDAPGRLDHIYYAADSTGPLTRACCDLIPECQCFDVGKPMWRPSIHMPRWASRLTLEVTGVRVERLHDISEADARAEGAEPVDIEGSAADSYVEGFVELWSSINGPESWATNPWVWVVEFRRLELRAS